MRYIDIICTLKVNFNIKENQIWSINKKVSTD
jgi:hypothetical protein